MATLYALKIRPTEAEERATSKTFSMRLLKFQSKELWNAHRWARIFNASSCDKTPSRSYDERLRFRFYLLIERAGAPVGSVLVGSQDFIDQAHRWRKMFGGGMRQSGILAAAGIYALENNVERMEDDHRRAKPSHKQLTKWIMYR